MRKRKTRREGDENEMQLIKNGKRMTQKEKGKQKKRGPLKHAAE